MWTVGPIFRADPLASAIFVHPFLFKVLNELAISPFLLDWQPFHKSSASMKLGHGCVSHVETYYSRSGYDPPRIFCLALGGILSQTPGMVRTQFMGHLRFT